MSEVQTLEGAVKKGEVIQVNGMAVQPVVEKCEGCERMRAFDGQSFCSVSAVPASKWRMGARCNMATHIQVSHAASQKVNPLKASKRASKK